MSDPISDLNKPIPLTEEEDEAWWIAQFVEIPNTLELLAEEAHQDYLARLTESYDLDSLDHT